MAGPGALQVSRLRVALYGGVSRHHPTKPRRVHQYRCPLRSGGHWTSPPGAVCPGTTPLHCICRPAMQQCRLLTGGHPHGWVFSGTSRTRWSLHLATASPQTLSLPQHRERQVACAWQCKCSGDSYLSPKICIRKEITNLIFIAPAERCKGRELSAASRPIHLLGLAARPGFVGTWKFPALPRPSCNRASSSAAGRPGTPPRCSS